MGTPALVHLSAQSHYSFHSSILRISDLVEIAQHAGTIALADEGNLFGHPEFAHQCQEHRIKPIFGMTVRITTPNEPARVTLLATNPRGYGNLLKLASRPFLSDWTQPLVLSLDRIASHAEGLLAIDGFQDGLTTEAFIAGFDRAKAVRQAAELEAIFGKGRLFLELHLHDNDNRSGHSLAGYIHHHTGINVVLCFPLRMKNRGDAQCLHLWRTIGRRGSSQNKIPSGESTMSNDCFPFRDGYPVPPDELRKSLLPIHHPAMRNSVRIARRSSRLLSTSAACPLPNPAPC